MPGPPFPVDDSNWALRHYLADVLRKVNEPRDGEPCWCPHYWRQVFSHHLPACEDARAVLETLDPTRKDAQPE